MEHGVSNGVGALGFLQTCLEYVTRERARDAGVVWRWWSSVVSRLLDHIVKVRGAGVKVRDVGVRGA